MLNTNIILLLLILIVFLFFIYTFFETQIKRFLQQKLYQYYILSKTYIKKLYKRLKNARRFRHLFLLYAISLAILFFVISWILHISFIYLGIYLFIIYVIYGLIQEISEKIEKKYLTKKKLFYFILFYFFIMGVFIYLFSQVYFYVFIFNDGSFFQNDKLYIVRGYEPYFISAITFLSYDVGLYPTKYMRIALITQLFVSQIMILGFFFIIFGELIGKINKKRKKRRRRRRR